MKGAGINMEYVLGIDSGGTKFLVKALGMDGKELAEYEGRPAGLYRFSRKEAICTIQENLEACIVQAGLTKETCRAIVCGTTGIDSEEDRREVEEIYCTLQGFTCPVLCVNDAEVALYAATGGVGVVVISGTGSIAFGRNSDYEIHRCGGWPPCIFGDEGSGVWLNLKALAYMSQVLDGRKEATLLYDLLNQELSIKGSKDLINLCQRIEKENAGFLKLGAIVMKALREGDKNAMDIIRQEAALTFSLADCVIEKLKMYQAPEFLVGTWGSAIVKNTYHFELFKENLERKYPNGKVVIAQKDAAYGACRIALDILQGESRIYNFE